MLDTNGKSEDSDDSNQLAYAGITLFSNQATGRAPEWYEISAWCDGKLSAARAADVLSHVANNAEYFQQWVDITQARQWLSEEALESASSPVSDNADHVASSNEQAASADTHARPPTNQNPAAAGLYGKLAAALGNWRSVFTQPLPVYGGALAAIALAVLIVPLVRDTQHADLQQQLDRSTDSYIQSQAGLPSTAPVKFSTKSLEGLFPKLSESDVERQNFQFGLRRAALAIGTPDDSLWQQWMTELPDSVVECSNAENTGHCTDVQNDMMTLGQWALLSYAACQQPESSVLASEFWTNQLALFDQLSTTDTIARSALFGSSFADAADQSIDTLCSAVTQLLARGQ